MMKDLNKDAYAASDKDAPMDIKLANRDTEINMGPETYPEKEEKEKESKRGKENDSMITIDKNEIVDIQENKKDGSILQDKKAGSKMQNTRNDKSEIKKDTTSTQPMGLDPNTQS